jgi:uncharacterized membrane protein YfcA
MGVSELVGIIVLGLVAGTLSGLLGIGGAIIVIPCLVLIRGFTPQQAAGTSLAMMLPPIGIFAVMRYHRAGHVDPTTAVVLAVVFAVGAYFGASLVASGKINDLLLRRAFGFFLLYVAAQILIKSDSRVRAAAATAGLLVAYGAGFWALRAIGKRWERRFDIRATYQNRLTRPILPEYQI